MKILRTPDHRFDNLPDFDFTPHYIEIDDGAGGRLRLHYLDEGPRLGPIVLLMHGEPTWSYLYRHMIPIFAEAGCRVLAPDLIGFGRSDKPANRADYTYQRHVDWMSAWLRGVDARAITMLCQDWGGLIGLRLVADMPDRFSRLVLANTDLPTGDTPPGAAFLSWRQFSQDVPEFNAGRIVHGGTTTKLTEAETAAYNAPFPDESYRQGARQFPMLVPVTPDDPASVPNRAAWAVLRGLSLPVLTAFGADDRIMAGRDAGFQEQMPGASGQPHRILPGAGHFLQEDVGPDLARATLDLMART